MMHFYLLPDLLEGVDVNPERPTKKQSTEHMPSYGKNKLNSQGSPV